MQSKLYFHGGAGTVTGANFLLESGNSKFLIDCGLFQGAHTCSNGNWEPFPYEPRAVLCLIVTHAHIDHIGRIPKLVRDGFAGTILSTHATRALAEPLLLDALELLQSEAERSGKPPLYGKEDVAQTMRRWETIGYHEKKELSEGFELELLDAGHILGSAMVKLTREGRNIVFTGDLGGGNSPLLPPTESAGRAQYLVIESVYGDRVRKDEERRELLENVIEDTAARGGSLLIPAFSTERTQDILFEIRTLMVERRVPSLPVYLDSPLAQTITRAFLAHPRYFEADIRARVEAGEKIFDFPELRFAQTPEESREIHEEKGQKIILAGSGMMSGGRVLTHQKHILPDEKSTLLIVGYQAAGSAGRRLLEGAKELRIGREMISVRAKVEAIFGYSAHMDGEKLLEFAGKAAEELEEVFVVEGEPAAASFLAQRVRDYLGIKATAPEAGESVTLEL